MKSPELKAETILERIRERVRNQGRHSTASASAPTPLQPPRRQQLWRLRAEVEQCSLLHATVGVINPRGDGVVNGIAQLLKKAIRRSLSWYTRPLQNFQSATIRAFNANVDMFREVETELKELRAELQNTRAELEALRATSGTGLERAEPKDVRGEDAPSAPTS